MTCNQARSPRPVWSTSTAQDCARARGSHEQARAYRELHLQLRAGYLGPDLIIRFLSDFLYTIEDSRAYFARPRGTDYVPYTIQSITAYSV